jgi:hypothetical protein
MSAWLLVMLAVILVACFLLSPVLMALWRNVPMLSHANSPGFRLSMPNLWTEIQQVQGAGSTQLMRMEDGNIVFLSVGLDTAKVFITPQLDSTLSFSEVASFPISRCEGETLVSLCQQPGGQQRAEQPVQVQQALTAEVLDALAHGGQPRTPGREEGSIRHDKYIYLSSLTAKLK